MSLYGKMEADIEIKASAGKIHDVFGGRPHHMAKASPHKLQSCDLHEGEFGKKGSVIYWNYVHDGVAKVEKEIVEDIDDVNMSTTYKVIEGDLLKEYKKLNADMPDPTSLAKIRLQYWS